MSDSIKELAERMLAAMMDEANGIYSSVQRSVRTMSDDVLVSQTCDAYAAAIRAAK